MRQIIPSLAEENERQVVEELYLGLVRPLGVRSYESAPWSSNRGRGRHACRRSFRQ